MAFFDETRRLRAVAALLARRTEARRGVRSAVHGRGGATALPAHVLAALCLRCIVAAGCTGTTGHLAAVSTRDLDLTAVGDAPARHMIGRSCINLIVVVPTGVTGTA